MQYKCCFVIFFITSHLLYLQASSQVKEIPEIQLPDRIIRQYPFLTNNFTFIKSPDSMGLEGYFLFTLNKDVLYQFIEKKISDQASAMLSKYRLKRPACKQGINNCGFKNSTFQDFSFKRTTSNYMLLSNKIIDHVSNYTLDATKVNTYYTRTLRHPDCRRKRDRHRHNLMSARVCAKIRFEYDSNGFSIKLVSELDPIVNILYSGCNVLLSPYKKISTMIPKTEKDTLLINLNSASRDTQDLLKIYLNNTKRIRITEDKNYYYVYCIRSKA